MKSKIIAMLASMSLAAAVLVSGTPDASASVVPASGCTGYLTATSAYNGSTLQGKTIVLAIGCTAAQASISYQSNGVQYGNGAYLTGSNVTSTAWAGNNNVVQHIGYIWVGSGLYRYYF